MNATGSTRIYFGELPAENAELIDGEVMMVDYGPYMRTSAGVEVTVYTPKGIDQYHAWNGGTDADVEISGNPKEGHLSYDVGPAGELAIIHAIYEPVAGFETLLLEASTLRTYAPGAWTEVTGTRHKDPHYI
ncbi:hypothetical protein [Arthrobacter sp. MAHUQ-56]